MRDRSEIWCAAAEVSIVEIDRRALLAFERTGVVTVAFISPDLYSTLVKDVASSMRGQSVPTGVSTGVSAVRIMSSIGDVHLKVVPKYRNLLFVGMIEEFDAFVNAGVDPIYWSDEERARIDKAFEDLVILEGENEIELDDSKRNGSN